MVRRTLSPLQRKGFSLLSLILIAESVTFSNAVTLWSNYESWMEENGRRFNSKPNGFFNFKKNSDLKKSQECLAFPAGSPLSSDSSKSCPSSPPLKLSLAKLFNQRGRSPTRRFAADCCAECSNCMETSRVMRECNIPRGGHSAAHGAEKLAGAVIEAGVTPYGLPLHLWKIVFQAILTTINVACWLLPLRSKKISENKLGLSLANAFSGGVFLSLAFGHLIPECVHGFADFQEAVPYMLVLAGYLVIFFIEKVAFDAHDILHEMEHADHKHGKDEKSANGVSDGSSSQGTGRSAVILLGALAVHSILEMMALGLADSFGDCALLTLSIALHQPAESIALLVAFLKSGMPKSQIIQFLSIFSAMGPIGVALGIAVNEFAAPIVDSAMLAIVAGTFVYVGATEVIPEEWEESEHKWKKFAALMSGIVSIFFITQYTMTLGIH